MDQTEKTGPYTNHTLDLNMSRDEIRLLFTLNDILETSTIDNDNLEHETDLATLRNEMSGSLGWNQGSQRISVNNLGDSTGIIRRQIDWRELERARESKYKPKYNSAGRI